jgi:hypothetical protein
LFCPPAKTLVAALSVEVFARFDVSVGAQVARVCAIVTSWICGFSRSMRMPRFCSTASRTASSTDSRRTVVNCPL